MFGSLMVFTDQVFTFLFLPLALGVLLVEPTEGGGTAAEAPSPRQDRRGTSRSP